MKIAITDTSNPRDHHTALEVYFSSRTCRTQPRLVWKLAFPHTPCPSPHRQARKRIRHESLAFAPVARPGCDACRGEWRKVNFQTSVVHGLYVRKSQLPGQCGGQQFKDRYDIVDKTVTGENNTVYVGGVNTGRELASSAHMKRASLTTVYKWMLSAWALLSRELVMRSFAKCGISLEDDVLWNSNSDGDTNSTTSWTKRPAPTFAVERTCKYSFLFLILLTCNVGGRPTTESTCNCVNTVSMAGVGGSW